MKGNEEIEEFEGMDLTDPVYEQLSRQIEQNAKKLESVNKETEEKTPSVSESKSKSSPPKVMETSSIQKKEKKAAKESSSRRSMSREEYFAVHSRRCSTYLTEDVYSKFIKLCAKNKRSVHSMLQHLVIEYVDS